MSLHAVCFPKQPAATDHGILARIGLLCPSEILPSPHVLVFSKSDSVYSIPDGCCDFSVTFGEAGKCLMGVQVFTHVPWRALGCFQGGSVPGSCLPSLSELGICCVPALVAMECALSLGGVSVGLHLPHVIPQAPEQACCRPGAQKRGLHRAALPGHARVPSGHQCGQNLCSARVDPPGCLGCSGG